MISTSLKTRFPDTATVAVLLVTSTPLDAPLIRVAVEPSPDTGLRLPSQVMIDKPMAVSTKRLGTVFGQLDDAAMLAVNRALLLFLGLAD